MENKKSKRSINTVIYLLLAAMLACVVFVSIYTVASKRRSGDEAPEQSTSQLDGKAPAKTSKPNAQTEGDESKKGGKSDVTSGTDESDGKSTTDDTKPADTTAAGKVSDGGAVSVGALPAKEDDERPASTDTRYFVLPVNGTPSKDFEIDIPVWSMTMDDYRAHTGVDIAAPLGDSVVSASSGTVCRVWNDPMMGYSVTIDHGDGIYTSYMNLSPEVEAPAVGTKVGMGQVIGSVGESALVEIAEEPHLHLEMKVGGSYVDPLEYISASEVYTDYAE